MIQILAIIGVLTLGAAFVYVSRSTSTKIVGFIITVLLFLFLLL